MNNSTERAAKLSPLRVIVGVCIVISAFCFTEYLLSVISYAGTFFSYTLPITAVSVIVIPPLTERFWNELVNFSRRTSSSLNRWAAKYATISNTVTETYRKAKDKADSRYVAVNLTNFATIEFRMFRGTLRYETFLATLQLVDELCRTALNLYDAELENLSWCEFVRRMDKERKPELIAYLKSRQLYINESTTDGEEV